MQKRAVKGKKGEEQNADFTVAKTMKEENRSLSAYNDKREESRLMICCLNSFPTCLIKTYAVSIHK
jgi:hypothetical protein